MIYFYTNTNNFFVLLSEAAISKDLSCKAGWAEFELALLFQLRVAHQPDGVFLIWPPPPCLNLLLFFVVLFLRMNSSREHLITGEDGGDSSDDEQEGVWGVALQRPHSVEPVR